MESEEHKSVVFSTATFFRKQGCKVTKEQITLNGRNIRPDLLIQAPGNPKLPFECGHIEAGLPYLYFLHFGAFYHTTKQGKLSIITTPGNCHPIGFIENIHQIRKPRYPEPIKKFIDIKRTLGYRQYKRAFVEQVRRVRSTYPLKGALEIFNIAFNNCKIISSWRAEERDQISPIA